jgi:hypothetical protein
MKRAPLDIDSKVLAGVIVGALTYALTKLAIPVDTQIEQAINVGAALLAAYLVPSKTPAGLTAEGEDDDVSDAPTVAETSAVHYELAALTAPAAVPQIEPASTNGHGGTATITRPVPASAEVDEAAHYGEQNLTGTPYAEVEDELDAPPLDENHE